jgi:hypothetical protein
MCPMTPSSHKFDQCRLWKNIPIIVDVIMMRHFCIVGMLHGDALQIGKLLKEHPVCSTIRVRGTVESCPLLKLAGLLTVPSDPGRIFVKIHFKRIKMNLTEPVHIVADREWIWLQQQEMASAINNLSRSELF